jgi:hypothetical protein
MESASEIAPGLPSNSRKTARPKKNPGRSRITNGALLPGRDGRGPWTRRCRDLINEFVNEQLAGVDNCSPAERAIVRRVSVLITELEILESKFADKGEASPAQLHLYQRVANTLRRLLESLAPGLPRRMRNYNQTPDDYFSQLNKAPSALDGEVVEESAS